MIGKTNAVQSSGTGTTPVVVKYAQVSQATGTGTRSFSISLTDLKIDKTYLCTIKSGDGALSIDSVTPSSSDAEFGNSCNMSSAMSISNMWNFAFKPKKAAITLTVAWNRVGGTDTRMFYCVQELQ